MLFLSGTLAYYPDLCLLTGVLTVWIPARYFAKTLYADLRKPQFVGITNTFKIVPMIISGNNKQDINLGRKLVWSEVYHLYQCMRELCQLINEAFGSLVTVYLGSFLMFQATNIDQVLLTPSIDLKIELLFFIIVSSTIFWLSADACNKV